MDIRSLEEIAWNAWPALKQIIYDGWLLRFSEGFTKRANAICPLYPSSQDVDEKISYCERIYHEAGLPPVFRITPLASPPNLDTVLARRGYRQLDITEVHVLELDNQPPPVQDCLVSKELWLEEWNRIQELGVENSLQLQRILSVMPYPAWFFLLPGKEKPAALAIGSFEGQYYGIFNLLTDPAQRRRGAASSLTNCILGHASQLGARYAYLQVEAANAPALELYRKFAFQKLYQYWYRTKS